MLWLRLQQPVSLHVHAATDNCQRVDVHAVHDHVNCTTIGHGAVVVMILNLDTSKCELCCAPGTDSNCFDFQHSLSLAVHLNSRNVFHVRANTQKIKSHNACIEGDISQNRMQVAFSVTRMRKKCVYSRTIDDNKIMNQLQRKQMCTERESAHDAQVFGNGSNSHNICIHRFSKHHVPDALNLFASTNIFYMLFDSLLEIISFLIPCSCFHTCVYVLRTAHFVGKMTRRANCMCVCECIWLPL